MVFIKFFLFLSLFFFIMHAMEPQKLARKLRLDSAAAILKVPVSRIKQLQQFKKAEIIRITTFRKYRSNIPIQHGFYATLQCGDSIHCIQFLQDPPKEQITCERIIKYDNGIFSIPLDSIYFDRLQKYSNKTP